ncbi:MAG: AzlC family ABC transporter permease [Oscillospiraceae bacterium]|nr:AzlC family ABC transporter permease [Oscillospiraceae bacterium]
MRETNRTELLQGLRDGLPIGLGYFAVSFTLGITARRAGLTAFQAALASFLTNASAGEAAGFTVIAEGGSYLTMAIMILVANARYLLMSTALTQKLRPETSILNRLIIGYDVTDEIFGVSIARPGWLCPFYSYGVFILPLIGWSSGTYLGVMMGNLLPANLVSALSVGLYGMFIAIIIPPARKERVIAVLVALSMILSYACARLPVVSGLSSGTRIIILTVLIAAGAALLRPVKAPDRDPNFEGGQ